MDNPVPATVDARTHGTRPLPLSGVRVVDLGQIYNGPYCGFLLAMAGADVIKVEPPGGENLRRRGVVGGATLPFAMLNSNKRTVTLNLKSERGRELLKGLVRRADIMLENFAPGALDRLGVGWDVMRTVNPRLIYAQGSGYGLTGPSRDFLAMDLTVQAMAGVMSINGFPDRPPVKAGPALCDFFGGVHLYSALMTALFERERTGQGRLVEVSMQEAVYASLASNLGLWYGTGGKAPPRTGNYHGGMAESPYNVYPTRDGHIAIICVNENHWHALLKAMGHDELIHDPRFASLKQRVANMADVDALVTDYTTRYNRQELFEHLMQHRVPCAPVRDVAEVVNDPHMHARGMLQWVDHPILGQVVLPHSPLRFDESEMLPIHPTGTLGRDNVSVFHDELGLSEEEVQTLIDEKVI
jgi:CoA:oxalate CoA-transferase